ncbi:MAG: UbiA family prenyltransferase, partial [Acidobacteriia bacterium]|nr:UbiA family prenyltransferase [Terriglobia bacterium]
MKAFTEALPVKSPETRGEPVPLVVDLDGTLLKTDLLLETLLVLLKKNPGCIFQLLLWWLKGKAYFKHQIAARTSLDAGSLPYQANFVDYLRAQRAAGRTIVLATASDAKPAREIADHLQLFDHVLASDGVTNLAGGIKRDRLVSQFGEKGFDYAGNESRDLAIWASARKAIVVNPSPRVRLRVSRNAEVERVFEDRRRTLADYARPLRSGHWLKNMLVFVPVLAAHRINEIDLLLKSLVAFFVFGLFASAGYFINDLFDVAADRRHPTKRLRAFASGNLPLAYGMAMAVLLAAVGVLVSAVASYHVLEIALAYFGLTLAYSLYCRNVVILDVIILAGLYSMRIVAGCVATAIWPSDWLLAFSTFLFFSLALVKRYGELAVMRRIDADGAKARAYEASDGELLAAMGIASGYLAVLVLALYINTGAAQSLYGHYEFIWFL